MEDREGVMREEKSLVVAVICLLDSVDGEGGQDLKRTLNPLQNQQRVKGGYHTKEVVDTPGQRGRGQKFPMSKGDQR